MITLSIITICYNNIDELKITIQSILTQDFFNYSHLELCIIDGNSSDGTKKFLETLPNEIPDSMTFKYVSECDDGIYDAMNKGIMLSSGKWIMFLNAGDVFHNKSVLNSLSEILDNSCGDVLYGNAIKYNQWIRQRAIPSKLENLKYDMIFCHQAMIFNRNIQEKYLYDTTYKIASDYNSVLKMYLTGAVFQNTNITIVDYDMHGVSGINIEKTFKEIQKIRLDNQIIKKGYVFYFWFFYGLVKRKVLKIIPQNFRWKIVMVKHKLFGHEALR